MEDWQYQIGIGLITTAIGFIIGLLFRKKTGQVLIATKKWLLNDFFTAKIISVRVYTNTNFTGFTRQTLHEASALISGFQLIDVFPNEVKISLPTFGNTRLRIGQIELEDEIRDGIGNTNLKVVIEPENIVRMGIREISLLHNYSHYTEVMFNIIEKNILNGEKEIINDYSIFETPRTGRFFGGETFELENKEQGYLIRVKRDRLVITISPTHELANIVKKYILS